MNSTLSQKISHIIEDAVGQIYPQERLEKVVVLQAPVLKYGDYSSPVALTLAKKMGKNPMEFAETIKKQIYSGLFEKVETASPGYLNFFLNKNLVAELAGMIGTKDWSEHMATYGQNKKLVIDYSAPNIAKPFGIGHLRSTNIGQAIYNIFQILGWKVIGDNHIGDWGTQFGKLIVAINKFNTKPLEELTIDDLEKLYVEFHKRAETDKTLVDEARDWFSKLENGDPEARNIWQLCIDRSMVEFDKVYNLLGVKIDFVHGESFYQDLMGGVVEELKKKNITTESQGATIVEFDDMPPAMVMKSNGATTYFTRDLATVYYRNQEWKPDKVIYEVGADQTLHFKQLFATADKLGWTPKEGFVHIPHGLIRWKEGKFSTRRGDTIHLKEVIDKAILEAKNVIGQANIQKNKDVSEEIATNIAVSAIKFADLSSEPRRDIVFDWERVLSLDGDSGPYLQYTYARINSLVKKSSITDWSGAKFENREIEMLRLLIFFEDKLLEAQERLTPNTLCTWAIEIARSFNEYYANNKVIGTPEEKERVLVAKCYQKTFQILFMLLGITLIEEL